MPRCLACSSPCSQKQPSTLRRRSYALPGSNWRPSAREAAACSLSRDQPRATRPNDSETPSALTRAWLRHRGHCPRGSAPRPGIEPGTFVTPGGRRGTAGERRVFAAVGEHWRDRRAGASSGRRASCGTTSGWAGRAAVAVAGAREHEKSPQQPDLHLEPLGNESPQNVRAWLRSRSKAPMAHAYFRTVWPSGLRRWLQAPVRKGVGSNPAAVN